ncbi:MAG: hypothetical protein ACLQKH_15150 [Steroidobacteraceae bacterium]
MAGIDTANISPYSNLLAPYQSPQAIAQSQASTNLLGAQATNTQANTEYTQAQTVGQSLTNQITQARLKAFSDYRAAIAGGATPADAAQNSDAAAIKAAQVQNSPPAMANLPDNPDFIDATVRDHQNSRFQVDPKMTPQEQAQVNAARQLDILAGGGTANYDAAIKPYQLRMSIAQTQAGQTATKEYDSLYTIANGMPGSDAPAGSALAYLQRQSDPDVKAGADNIAAMAKKGNWTPEQTDAFVKKYVNSEAAGAFPFSKYSTDAKEDSSGVLKDNTGRPVLGGTPAGLSQAQSTQFGIDTVRNEVAKGDLQVAAARSIEGSSTVATTAAGLMSRVQTSKMLDDDLASIAKTMTPAQLVGQVGLSNLSPTLQAFARAHNIIGKDNAGQPVVNMPSLIAAANTNLGLVDTNLATVEGIAGAGSSDIRAKMQEAGAGNLTTADFADPNTLTAKLALRDRLRDNAQSVADNKLKAQNALTEAGIQAAEKGGAHLDRTQLIIKPPAAPKQTIATPATAAQPALRPGQQQSGKTVNQAQVNDYATKNNLTPAQALAHVTANGYTVTP